MKGVSTVIAIVLILMITVALAALAYIWFVSVFQTISEGAGEGVEQATEQLGTSFGIETAKYTGSNQVTASLRNTGSQNIDLTKLATYINNEIAFIDSGNTGTLAPDGTATVKISNATRTGYFSGHVCSKALKVTIPAGQQIITITC